MLMLSLTKSKGKALLEFEKLSIETEDTVDVEEWAKSIGVERTYCYRHLTYWRNARVIEETLPSRYGLTAIGREMLPELKKLL